MKVSTARSLPASRIRTSRLPYEELTKRAQAVLTRYLRCGDPERHDPEEDCGSVDSVDEPVGLGQLREAREVPATLGRSLGKEENGEKRSGEG